MNNLKVICLLIITSALISCKEKRTNSSGHLEIREFYEDGTTKSITIYQDKAHKRKITYFPNGEIESIFHYTNDALHGEQLWFHENGVLDQKVMYDKGRRMDNAYFFYPSGRMKHSRIFKNDKEILFGAEYWDDSLNLIKSSLHFNDSGHIYYKKNFDTNGKFINEEGSKE